MIVFNGKLGRIWPYLSNFDLLKYIGLSPLLASPQEAPGSGGYPKRKTDPIFEIPTIENHRIDVLHDFFTFYSIFAVTAALAATASPLGRSGGILKEKLIPFMKSPLWKTIELMYHMIFYMFFSIFAVKTAPAAMAAPLGRSGGILKENLIPFLKSPTL